MSVGEPGISVGEHVPLEVDEGEPETPLEQMLGWARGAGLGPVREEALPSSVRAALEAARAEQPERRLSCLAFHTLVDGEEVARMGPEEQLPDAASLLALSVVVSETTASAVRVVAHVLVTRVDVAG
jgi:hypothetical protein